METRLLKTTCASLLALALVSSVACDVIMPLEPMPDLAEPTYFCSAQIYRSIPGTSIEFTEEWQCYIWPGTQAPLTVAAEKINEYISDCMAPGFVWKYRNLTATSSTKAQAAPCMFTYDDIYAGQVYGAPFGAEVRWNAPGSSQAYVYISLTDKNGTFRDATPGVLNAYVDFAERTGMTEDGIYTPKQRNIRFSDIFVDLDTPFELGSDLTITEFRIQSVGGVLAENVGGTTYQIMPYDSMCFMYAQAEKDGKTYPTSLCFANPYLQGFTEYQGPPNPSFTLSFSLDTTIAGQPVHLTVSLSKPPVSYAFKNYQPFVDLVDTVATSSSVDLTPDQVWDGDDNLYTYLWFEDFETSTEKFLGQGETLYAVPFNSGEHEVTVVVYDDYGSYNSDTMILTVPNTAPTANDDAYSVDEDSVLTVSAPGVLVNDADAEGDALTAGLESGPADGLLTLNSDGSFTYTPNGNYTGTDSFTYRADDGTASSDPATVTITVVEVPEDEEAEDLADMVRDLVDAGALNSGQGTGLLAKVDLAMERMRSGQTKVACNLLKAFVNEVTSLIDDGVLYLGQGQPLIDKANNIMEELGCS